MKQFLIIPATLTLLLTLFSIAFALPPAMIPKTGQTTSYSAGDDGDLQMGIEWPNPRFTVNSAAPDNGGSITDNLTGLIWTKDANTPGPSACTPGTQKNWQGALDYVTCLNTNSYLGHTDWRLPNSKELYSLVNKQQATPATWLNAVGQGFSNVQPYLYWSGSTYAGNTDNAWNVGMSSGYVSYNYKSGTVYVWPVRGGL